jgi:hypothetical protein
MSNANAKANKTQGHILPVESGANPHPSAANQTNDEIQDFFTRGEIGQYEGGAADRIADSVPTWDLPERLPVVRTPRQLARRAILVRIEALVLAGCLVLLVVAARLKLNNGIEKRTFNSHSGIPQPAELLVAKTAQVYPRQLQPSPTPVPEAKALQVAPTTATLALVKPPEVTSASASQGPQSPVAVASVIASPTTAVRKAPMAPSSSLGRAGQAHSVVSHHHPKPVATTRVVATRRSVAAFPDE